jgi:hypothetical protein
MLTEYGQNPAFNVLVLKTLLDSREFWNHHTHSLACGNGERRFLYERLHANLSP